MISALMGGQVELVIVALIIGLALIYTAPGFVAGLLWALLPVYGAYLPAGSGLIVCALGLALICIRCTASRDPRWLPTSVALLLALTAGILVTLRRLYDHGTFATTSLSMPLAIVIALFILFVGLSAAGRVGLLRGILVGASVIAGAEGLRVASGGAIHPESAAFGVNPITIGQFAALGILIAIFLIRLGISRALSGVALVVCAAGLAATNSRGPLLALGVACAAMYVQELFKREKKKRDFRLRPLIPLVVLMIAVSVISATSNQLYAWFRASDGDGNVSGRFDAWSAAWQSIANSTFLGQGADKYNIGNLGATFGLPTYPHNIFLEIWSEYGLVPFALLAVGVIIALRRSGDAGRPMALGFLVCFSISGSLDTSLGLWVALAVALTLAPTSHALSRQRMSQEKSGLQAQECLAEPTDPPVKYAPGELSR